MMTCSATDTTLEPETWTSSAYGKSEKAVHSYLEDLYFVFHSSIEVNVIRTDTRGDTDLEILRL